MFFNTIDWSTLEEVIQREVMQEIDQPISWNELKMSVIKLTNNKAPWLNKVPPNAYKALNDDNLTHLLKCFNKYWQEENDFDEWREGRIMPVPKVETYLIPKNGVASPWWT